MTIKVCIDAGHGGKAPTGDPGAVNGSKHEAVAALAIAKKVGAKLKAKGVTVKYTRSSDKYVTLANRCRISNEFGADAFVSIHLNAAMNTDAAGIETWRYEKAGIKTKQLAESVQAELIKATGARDRGVRTTETLYVLKKTEAPAVLIECGFISNRGESERLADGEYQNTIARGIAQGVLKYWEKN